MSRILLPGLALATRRRCPILSALPVNVASPGCALATYFKLRPPLESTLGCQQELILRVYCGHECVAHSDPPKTLDFLESRSHLCNLQPIPGTSLYIRRYAWAHLSHVKV